MTQICVLPGDGIGPEVVGATVRVLDALRLGFEWVWGDIGFGAHARLGASLPAETVDKVAASDATLFGAVTTPPSIADYRSPILALRQQFDLFANVRPCRSMPHESSRPGIDLVIVRENTEGLYCGVERTEADGDTAVAERRITRAACERVIRFAYRLARERGDKRRVTLVHKANVLRVTCGLFRTVGLEIAAQHDDVVTDERLVDACAMDLIRRPEHFDVIVTTNLFGDILSDEACMLVGGLGLACSANLGDEAAVFEPVHGSAPDIAGQGIANPLAAILSGALMLEHLDCRSAADAVREAVRRALVDGRTPPDLGGALSTDAVTDAVIANLP